jgi:hypothetical protein
MESSVVGPPRPSGTVGDDSLLAVLREGARWMLMQAIEAEMAVFMVPLPRWSTNTGAGIW